MSAPAAEHSSTAPPGNSQLLRQGRAARNPPRRPCGCVDLLRVVAAGTSVRIHCMTGAVPVGCPHLAIPPLHLHHCFSDGLACCVKRCATKLWVRLRSSSSNKHQQGEQQQCHVQRQHTPSMRQRAWKPQACLKQQRSCTEGLTISSNPPPGADRRDSRPTIGKLPWIFFATRLTLASMSLHKWTGAAERQAAYIHTNSTLASGTHSPLLSAARASTSLALLLLPTRGTAAAAAGCLLGSASRRVAEPLASMMD